MKKYISGSVEETITIGKEFSRFLDRGDVVALEGDLGAGKTHFIKGVVSGKGSDELVTSPTFNLVQEYRKGQIPVFHFDFYRLESPAELAGIGFEEYLFGDGICLMEWAEKVKDFLPEETIRVKIERLSEEKREITIERPDER